MIFRNRLGSDIRSSASCSEIEGNAKRARVRPSTVQHHAQRGHVVATRSVTWPRARMENHDIYIYYLAILGCIYYIAPCRLLVGFHRAHICTFSLSPNPSGLFREFYFSVYGSFCILRISVKGWIGAIHHRIWCFSMLSTDLASVIFALPWYIENRPGAHIEGLLGVFCCEEPAFDIS